MDKVYKKFHESIIENALVNKNEHILIALSGGADSVFLLNMLYKLKEEYNLKLSAFHLNHNLRENALRDENFCRDLCEELNINFHAFSYDINAISKELNISVEEAGRIKRYEIIESLKGSFDKAATAHHADDNAETIIMRIIRGTGINGLTAIPKIREDYIIRPLLNFTKDEITTYLKENNISYVTDETNYDNDYFRNRIRNEIIPVLKKENENLVSSLNRLSVVASFYVNMADNEADKIKFDKNSSDISVNYDELSNQNEAVLYSFVKKAASELGEGSDIHFENIIIFKQLLDKKENTSWDCDFPYFKVMRRYDEIKIALKNDEEQKFQSFSYNIKVPSLNVFALEKFSLKFYVMDEAVNINNFQKNNSEKYITAVDYDKIDGNITIRNKKEGDFYNQIGLSGKKSVKKLFIDRKIPREIRNNIPLILCSDKIISIIGLENDDNFKVDDNTKLRLIIEYKSWR